MYMRLAFAVAAHLDPDVLLVDEVLAVGDAQFQKKCLGKVEKVSAAGRTVLLVSHNMQAISTLAQRCFLLRGGQLDSMAPRDAIAAYLSEHASRSGRYVGEASAEHPRVTGVEVHTSDPDCVHRHGEPFVVDFEVSTPRPLANAALSLQVCDDLGRPVVHLWTFDSERPWCRRAGGFLARCRIPVFRLYMGRYTLTVHLADGSGAASVQTLEGLCPFEVVMHGHARDFPWRPNACVYLEESEWSVSERPSE
jgi:lipopolysaccharide transport system ATP-binding protein